MNLAAIDMSPVLGVSLGLVLALASAWYWHHLGHEGVERSTRALRRCSLVLAVLAVFALVRAACFVDSEVNPSAYISAWLIGLTLMFLVVLVVGVDVFNSFRMHRIYVEREALETAARLKAQLKEFEEASTDNSESVT